MFYTIYQDDPDNIWTSTLRVEDDYRNDAVVISKIWQGEADSVTFAYEDLPKVIEFLQIIQAGLGAGRSREPVVETFMPDGTVIEGKLPD